MRLDVCWRRRRCASPSLRVSAALLMLPILAVLARADELPLDPVNPKGHSGEVLGVAFTPDGKTLAIGGADGIVRLWDVNGWTERAALPGARGMIADLAFAPGGKILASACEGSPTVSLWDVAQGRLAATLTLPGAARGDGVSCLAFAPDGNSLYTGGERGIEAWDVTPGSRALVRTATSSVGH